MAEGLTGSILRHDGTWWLLSTAWENFLPPIKIFAYRTFWKFGKQLL